MAKAPGFEMCCQRHLFCDLLDHSIYLELSQKPTQLGAMIGKLRENSWVVIDEIQKIAELLDEVHRLLETRKWRFALCASAVRKLRRKGTNLLGGRALTRQLSCFSWQELGDLYDYAISIFHWNGGCCLMSNWIETMAPIFSMLM